MKSSEIIERLKFCHEEENKQRKQGGSGVPKLVEFEDCILGVAAKEIERLSKELELVKGKPNLVLMPSALTAENGAKYIFSGEFFEVIELDCPYCDLKDEDCETCGGNGSYTYRVPISWNTIKNIYKLSVEKLGVNHE